MTSNPYSPVYSYTNSPTIPALPANTQSAPRRVYHHRSESSVLKTKNKSLHRKRSHTADSTEHVAQSQYLNHLKSVKKRINRRFESIPELNKSQNMENFKFTDPQYGDEKETEVSYRCNSHASKSHYHSKTTNDVNETYHTQQLQDLVRQFREIVVPLQTEITSLRQITKQLQEEVSVLQNENRLYRQYRYNYTNRNSPNAAYVDLYAANRSFTTPSHHKSFSPNQEQQVNVNPVYLFKNVHSNHSNRRNASCATLGM